MKSDNRTLPVIVFFHLQHGWEIKWNKYVEGVVKGCLDASSILAISTNVKNRLSKACFLLCTTLLGENWSGCNFLRPANLVCLASILRVRAVIFAISTKQKQFEHTSGRIFCLVLLFLIFSLSLFHSLLIRLCFEWGTKKEKWKALTKFDYIWLYIINII